MLTVKNRLMAVTSPAMIMMVVTVMIAAVAAVKPAVTVNLIGRLTALNAVIQLLKSMV